MTDRAASGLVAYFGYGSLVNRATHRTNIVDALPARLKGWRRCWRPRDDAPALLSVRRQADAICDGLLVFDRLENLPAVDEREAGYERVALQSDDLILTRAIPGDCPIYVYEAKVPRLSRSSHIIQSYLDAVLQGFLHHYGEAGVRRFVEETEGFETAILPDRLKPTYPRPVQLHADERAFLDAVLTEKGMRFLPI